MARSSSLSIGAAHELGYANLSDSLVSAHDHLSREGKADVIPSSDGVAPGHLFERCFPPAGAPAS